MTSAVRSPTRSTKIPTGTEPTNSATATIDTKSAATLTEAPSSRAVSATTGTIAPWPIEPTRLGP